MYVCGGGGEGDCKAGFVILKVSQYAGYYACSGSFKTVAFESLGNSPQYLKKTNVCGYSMKFAYFIMKLHFVCTQYSRLIGAILMSTHNIPL